MRPALYTSVRVKSLVDPNALRDGWRFNKRPPAVGDVGVFIDVLSAPGLPDHLVVEMSDESDGTTIWLSEFLDEEIEAV